MMRKILTTLLVAALGLTSCKKDEINNIEEIGYGTSFGMCVGYCLNNVAIINSGKVTFTKSANGISPNTKTCTKAIGDFDFKALKALVSVAEFNQLPEVIGCPDCADGGAEWVALKLEGRLKKVTFEYGNAPEALKDLVVKLREIKEEFKDCNFRRIMKTECFV